MAFVDCRFTAGNKPQSNAGTKFFSVDSWAVQKHGSTRILNNQATTAQRVCCKSPCLLQMLATEGPKSVTDLAARTNRLQHSLTKHMQVLRAAGAVVMVAGKLFHALPPGCLRDGANGKEIDYVVCVLRLR